MQTHRPMGESYEIRRSDGRFGYSEVNGRFSHRGHSDSLNLLSFLQNKESKLSIGSGSISGATRFSDK
jgi:hypothetical protein